MPQLKPMYRGIVIAPAATALALQLVTETDLLRMDAELPGLLKSAARLNSKDAGEK